ncbi:hypothetical protein ACKVMT_09660 [Halobacteriales archaeon Cl-PHB]
MTRRKALYSAAMAALLVGGIGVWILVDLGHTEPWLSASDVPGGSTGVLAGVLVVFFAGVVVLGSLQRRQQSADWKAAGRQAGLRPTGDDGDSTSGAELTGTVDGRSVTARYELRHRNRSTEGQGTVVTFTVGEAALTGSADAGVVVGTAGEALQVEDGTGTLDFDDMAETAAAMEGLVAAESGDLVLVGTSATAVEALAEGVSGDALRAVRDLTVAAVGDASGVVASWAGARNEELEAAGSIVEFPVENLVDRVPGDAATVTVEMEGSIQDGDELHRFAEGVVAIGDAFEAATARTPAAD